MVRCLVIALALVGCSRASDEGRTKHWQDKPPPSEVAVPANISIEVSVDGAARPPITSATLGRIKPDFADEDRRAWLITTLIADAAPAGSRVEASGPSGVSLELAHPTPAGLEPVLFLTRRGGVTFSEIDPKDPFPRYHGQGGRLHRAGDSMPRIAPVTRLAITHPVR
jgi:hypothetical protein